MPKIPRLFAKATVFFLVLSSVAISLNFFVRAHLYRGPQKEPKVWTNSVNRTRIVEEARKLVGIWYDPLQGYFGNLGGQLGLIVCVDVPVIAYRNAGASIRRLLESDYARHPYYYHHRDGKPGNPFFHRRARNLYSYCKSNELLDLKGPPSPGDLVFLSRSRQGAIMHIALVSQVDSEGRYWVVEASRDYFHTTREAPAEDLSRRGWVFRGFANILGPV